MRTPKIGDIVHFFFDGYKSPCPAIIYTLFNEEDGIGLIVFCPDPKNFSFIHHKDKKKSGIGSWSWPEEEKPLFKKIETVKKAKELVNELISLYDDETFISEGYRFYDDLVKLIATLLEEIEDLIKEYKGTP